MIDVRDLKWEVLPQTENDKYCNWRKVQILYHSTEFFTHVTDDMFHEPELLANHLLDCQQYVLVEIGHRIKQTRNELKHQTLD